ncbi:hypothetical protein QUF88_13805 [Bacillus sp. DX1.1]|uniref:hypothetical protein n=1 Tax=unclassified Bacillus (in: firmicutes) TaxID=185979 RepID=UPI0025705FD7|nr:MULTISPECIES: hypothetical protein [unclassified Bacillus (in: firmicutes)]MDM5154858.1 hypothetical protein [Bacillus sp. DX1.1]WJE83732.1 hypothetical protein QRE67_11300 [Bacillus sp. DX3.1]
MRVFRMLGIDFVCAETVEQAIKFYAKETGLEIEEIETELLEVSLQNRMLIPVEDLPPEEQTQRQAVKSIGGTLFTMMPFEWVIKRENIKNPCIIASTEVLTKALF